MPLVDNPNKTIVYDAERCEDCGTDLTNAPVARVERRQVTDITPPPPPYVTEHRIITRTCPCCTASWAGTAPDGVAARARYGPRVLATAAELTCAHYLPVGRATALLATLAGVEVSVPALHPLARLAMRPQPPRAQRPGQRRVRPRVAQLEQLVVQRRGPQVRIIE